MCYVAAEAVERPRTLCFPPLFHPWSPKLDNAVIVARRSYEVYITSSVHDGTEPAAGRS